MATWMFAGRLAAATHAYPTWSYAVQLAAAQLVMEVGGRTARPARPGLAASRAGPVGDDQRVAQRGVDDGGTATARTWLCGPGRARARTPVGQFAEEGKVIKLGIP